MADKRKIEIFSAGCAACEDLVAQVRAAACDNCEVTVLPMHDTAVAARAKKLGVKSVPAVAINGALAACCTSGGPDLDVLRAAGLGQPT